MDRPSLTLDSHVKRTGRGIFLVLVFFLMLFPFINTLNEFLVRVVESVTPLRFLQDSIIPYEARLVRFFLHILAVPLAAGDPYSTVITLIGKSGGLDPVAIAWNCLGWQSMLLIIASLFMGIQGNFIAQSKIELVAIGLMLTFWINIGRLTTIFYLYYHFNRSVAMMFHDYGSIIITMIWLMGFWWWAFKFVLQPRNN